jgi:segregation and condensation protein A
MVTVDPSADQGEEHRGLPVELPLFSGPLDLLLHLVHKNRVSITDIPIALICNQYQKHLSAMQELDLEVAAEFLWMASWLLQLKSKALLPRHSEDDEDPRAELVERLLEYRRVKEVAAILYERHVVRRSQWEPGLRPAVSEERELVWEDVDLAVLARAYDEVMRLFEAAHPPPMRVAPLLYTVGEKMNDLYRAVCRDGLFPLLSHLHTRPDPEEVVTLLVAALELTRLGGICTEQSRAFAEIYLRPGPRRLEAAELLHHGEIGGS